MTHCLHCGHREEDHQPPGEGYIGCRASVKNGEWSMGPCDCTRWAPSAAAAPVAPPPPPSLFDPPHPVVEPTDSAFRRSDPETSRQAGRADHGVRMKRGSQRHRLLLRFAHAQQGLTGEEAATAEGITRGSPWKRCSELRAEGYIESTRETRVGTLGQPQEVSVITTWGLAALEILGALPTEEAE